MANKPSDYNSFPAGFIEPADLLTVALRGPAKAAEREKDVAPELPLSDEIHFRALEEPERWDGMS